MELNSEGLVEITTIENYVPEIPIIPDGDKFQKLILEFDKLGYFELHRDFFFTWVIIKIHYLHLLFNFHKNLNLVNLERDVEWNTYFMLEDFNETFFNYMFFCTNRTIFKKKKLRRINSNFVLCLNLKKKHPFMNMLVWNETWMTASAGILLKKLFIDEKKSRKHIKTLMLLLKLIFKEMAIKYKNYDKIIFNIKGTKKKIHKILHFCRKKINHKNTIILFTPNFYQNSIKFKKIRAIKRRLFKRIAYK